jgi:hypothetical protein
MNAEQHRDFLSIHAGYVGNSGHMRAFKRQLGLEPNTPLVSLSEPS